MIVSQNNREILIKDRSLVEDLFIKWGYEVTDKIEVKNIQEIISELREWGVTWKWI